MAAKIDLPSQQHQDRVAMAYIADDKFWEEESEAPLLLSNLDFLGPQTSHDVEGILARVAKWPELSGADMEATIPERPEEEVPRILTADAERTFATKRYREQLIDLLHTIHGHFGDYHQGLGYVASFLSLVMERDRVIRLLLHLNSNERFMPGYWKAAPPAYVRDSKVFERLLAETYPDIAQKLRSAGVVPEAYASKWFVGLNIHVLPFRSLFNFIENYLQYGHIYLFQFALQLVAKVSDELMATPPTDIARMFALLRLDPSVLPERNSDPEFFVDDIAKALAIDVDMDKVNAWRKEEMAKIEAQLARIKALEKEDSDDEITFSDESSSDSDSGEDGDE